MKLYRILMPLLLTAIGFMVAVAAEPSAPKGESYTAPIKDLVFCNTGYSVMEIRGLTYSSFHVPKRPKTPDEVELTLWTADGTEYEAKWVRKPPSPVSKDK